MTNEEQKLREFAEKWGYLPDIYKYEPEDAGVTITMGTWHRDKEGLVSDLTALIEEHYVSKEEINQEVERRIAETVAGKFIAVEIEKRIADRFPGKEEILKYFNNHFNCYTDVTIRDYETTEIAMTNIAVLKMFEWLRSRLTNSSQKTEGGGE